MTTTTGTKNATTNNMTSTHPLLGQTPDFTMLVNGEHTTLANLRGTPVMLNVFHSGCPWCRAEMPQISDAYAHQANLDVRVFGVMVGQDTVESAHAFLAERPMRFPVLVDADGEFRRAFPLGRVPAVVAIDRDGFVVRVYEGFAEQLPGIVEQTLLSLARGDELPDYSLVGEGCALGDVG